MKLRWGQNNNNIADKPPTRDALLMCKSIKSGKIKEYLGWLEKLPEKKVIDKFSGIIYSESTGLPILQDQELPPVKLEGVSFDPIQNIQAKMMTKVTLLLVVESESKKLGIWHEYSHCGTKIHTRNQKICPDH